MKEYNYNRVAEEAAEDVELDFGEMKDRTLEIIQVLIEKVQGTRKGDPRNGFVIAASVALMLFLGVAVYYNSNMRLYGTYYAFDMMGAGPTYMVLDSDGSATEIYAIDGEELLLRIQISQSIRRQGVW